VIRVATQPAASRGAITPDGKTLVGSPHVRVFVSEMSKSRFGIGAIEDRTHIEALAECALSEDPMIRIIPAVALGEVESDDPLIVSVLELLQNDDDERVNNAAEQSLKRKEHRSVQRSYERSSR
jgi:HEAT repeat protein